MDGRRHRGIVRGYADGNVSVELVDVGCDVELSKFRVKQLPNEFISVRFTFFSSFCRNAIKCNCILGAETFHQVASDRLQDPPDRSTRPGLDAPHRLFQRKYIRNVFFFLRLIGCFIFILQKSVATTAPYQMTLLYKDRSGKLRPAIELLQ